MKGFDEMQNRYDNMSAPELEDISICEICGCAEENDICKDCIDEIRFLQDDLKDLQDDYVFMKNKHFELEKELAGQDVLIKEIEQQIKKRIDLQE